MQTAGSSYSWLKENLCQSEVERAGREGTSPYELINAEISKSPPGARGILFLPYLLGERSPRWNPKAKGAWIGLKLENRREDLFRAVLEGVGLNLQIILSAMAPFVPIKEIILIGGGAKGALWRQMLADIFRLPVLVPEYLEEATSMGAAIIGGVGCGLYSDFRSAQDFVRVRERVQPEERTAEVYDALKPVFEKCYSALEPVFECL
jgi:xylulokinase